LDTNQQNRFSYPLTLLCAVPHGLILFILISITPLSRSRHMRFSEYKNGKSDAGIGDMGAYHVSKPT